MSYMDDVNKLLIRLATMQASLLVNANAKDDDLAETWQQLKEDYESLKTAMDKYIRGQE